MVEVNLTLDSDTIERARQSRDSRFDGRFFVGVKTTGIYCRPVCPVKVPKRENVEIFSSAAAAAGAGYRPCLRCHPELSPGHNNWTKSGRDLAQALKLIDREVAKGLTIRCLADALHISTRQLNRLFRDNLGTTPSGVIQTKRLHFAKQLLDQTSLPVTDVCFASGFKSVRRFNDVVRDTFNKTPTQLRRQQSVDSQSGQAIRVILNYRPPYDWRHLLQFFSRRAIAGVEVCGATTYQRSIAIGNQVGCLRMEFSKCRPVVQLEVDFPGAKHLMGIIDRVRDMFDLNADSYYIEQTLADDGLLAELASTWSGTRVPGAWDGFEVAVRAIVGQQVSVPAAITLLTRLVNRCGKDFSISQHQLATREGQQILKVFPGPQEILDNEISGLGITENRVQALYSLCRAVVEGELRFDAGQAIEAFQHRFKQIRGIGDWSAQYVAMRALRDPNAFPHGDLILRRVAAELGIALSAAGLLRHSRAWEPWRAYATMLMWRSYQA